MSMASSWPSGDDLMRGPPPRCTPAPAPAHVGLWDLWAHFSAGNGNGTKGCVIFASRNLPLRNFMSPARHFPVGHFPVGHFPAGHFPGRFIFLRIPN